MHTEELLLEELKKPLQKKAALWIVIKRFFTDINGTIVDKLTVPLSLQQSYPFWMFGQFDKAGGYRIGNIVTPPDLNTPYVGSYVYGINTPFLFATGLNNINNQLGIGDIVHVFTDNIQTPNHYIFIVQQCPGGSIASVVENARQSETQKLNIEGANYFAFTGRDENLQFVENLNFTVIDPTGTSYKNYPKNPLASQQVFNKQNFVYFPLPFQVDQYQLVSSNIAFLIDEIQFSFKILKNTKHF